MVRPRIGSRAAPAPPALRAPESTSAASQKLSDAEALQKGMEAKAMEFVKQGEEIYRKESLAPRITKEGCFDRSAWPLLVLGGDYAV